MTRCDAIDCEQPADRTLYWTGDYGWDTTYECRYHSQESFLMGSWCYPGYRPVAVFAGIRNV